MYVCIHVFAFYHVSYDYYYNVAYYVTVDRTQEEKRAALLALKKQLLEDFSARNMAPHMANQLLCERFQLFLDYTKSRVPFALAMQRVQDCEERQLLLLEFERHILSPVDAENRMDRRLGILFATCIIFFSVPLKYISTHFQCVTLVY